ncbi:uncharacterized protein BDR25DRAFT_358251 [Lindgomyces ingoldianus]|uniref:Uncharacterized protein n=1 Tax=Lindgomyces ingoldianus TaxID=673940 RepID=A0ACB6QN89_9PLEO|nr:uncharacterized protein BDR25DRAFT_358251 [Lindgomyces ingoldianus]KAF2467995.1 hypothetical protein BDR25DRAFT_358251 [Lindgomyces ingoldianus]
MNELYAPGPASNSHAEVRAIPGPVHSFQKETPTKHPLPKDPHSLYRNVNAMSSCSSQGKVTVPAINQHPSLSPSSMGLHRGTYPAIPVMPKTPSKECARRKRGRKADNKRGGSVEAS